MYYTGYISFVQQTLNGTFDTEEGGGRGHVTEIGGWGMEHLTGEGSIGNI